MPNYNYEDSDAYHAEQLVKKLREKRAYAQRNSYEIGDYVSTCTGHTGVVQSYAVQNGDRYYVVRILDDEDENLPRRARWETEHQGGEWMNHLPKPEEVLGEEYFS